MPHPRSLPGRREEAGVTGLETAIVLISFVVVAAVFSFVVLSTGLFSSDRGRETVYAGLSKTRGSIQLTGGILAVSDQSKLTDLTLTATLAAGGESVNLDPAAANNRTIISYSDEGVSDNDLTYTVAVIVGDSDNALEVGEVFEINLDLSQNAAINITTNDTFMLEIKPPSGAYQVIQRTAPASLADTVIDLN